jgi:hypothetical protein
MKNTYTENNAQVAVEPKVKKEKAPKKGARLFVQILNGDVLTRAFIVENLGFIFYVMFLLLLLVGKGYYVKQLTDEIGSTEKALDETVSNYVDMKVKFEKGTTREKLLEQLSADGLKESVEPPKVIRVNSKEK